MLFHLSHFEKLLLDELLISQNRTHEATHIIIGEAAVDGVIYCRVSFVCVWGKGCNVNQRAFELIYCTSALNAW